jgi:hypothetical protein
MEYDLDTSLDIANRRVVVSWMAIQNHHRCKVTIPSKGESLSIKNQLTQYIKTV